MTNFTKLEELLIKLKKLSGKSIHIGTVTNKGVTFAYAEVNGFREESRDYVSAAENLLKKINENDLKSS